MRYEDFVEIWGDSAAEEYVIHSLEDGLNDIEQVTARCIITQIHNVDDLGDNLIHFGQVNYYKTTYRNITVRQMKKAIKQLSKVKRQITLPTGKITVKWFEELYIPLFGDEVEFKINKDIYPYIKRFRK